MNSHMRNPDRESTSGTRRLENGPALSDTLMERILAGENVTRAWRQVKKNHGVPGEDSSSPATRTTSLSSSKAHEPESAYGPQYPGSWSGS